MNLLIVSMFIIYLFCIISLIKEASKPADSIKGEMPFGWILSEGKTKSDPAPTSIQLSDSVVRKNLTVSKVIKVAPEPPKPAPLKPPAGGFIFKNP